MNASQRIDELVAGLGDWRRDTFAAVRRAVLEADAAVVEEWKYMGSPVWYCDGMIAVANAHQGKVKLTFAHGASLADTDKLFNAGLEGNARRAIDFLEGDEVNAPALTRLVRTAIEWNRSKAKAKAGKTTPAKKTGVAGKTAKSRGV
ncbi:DUF1801 domain-containing protein [Paraburkholderia sp. J41]|uniref:DUF1801 domain-containing protein n=1 Tax=Paraburkholderia sp. J41 TaxID=2805433 RepID=UPI002AC34363|nr:DUF1801 domain-containing protein [Paraburkholderia sp. J41]